MRLREHLRATGVAPELVLCSSAVRAVQTLAGVRDGLAPETAVEVEDGLYGAGVDELLERLRELPNELGSVMLVGHNPAIEGLAGELAGGGDPDALARLRAKYPTGGLATFAFEGSWRGLAPGAATLEAFVVPRELPKAP